MTQESGTQYENTSSSLVMQRFFKALKEENLMAAELWATHPQFNRTPHKESKVEYTRTFTRLFTHDDGLQISWVTVEWLLNHALSLIEGAPGYSFFRPTSEYSGRRRSGNNWRGWISDRARAWENKVVDLANIPERLRMYTTIVKLNWRTPPMDWLNSELGRTLLLGLLHPAHALDWAMQEGKRWDSEKGTYIKTSMNYAMIDLLQQEHEQFDVSRVGEELVREYSREDDHDAGRKLALRLLQHRDTTHPMPEEFTAFMKEALRMNRMYQKLYDDASILKGAKTNE